MISPLSRFHPYPAYKPSHVPWLGEVPAHWEVRRLKFISTEPLQYGANEVAEIIDPELPRFIRITDINADGTLRDDTFRSLPEDVAQPFLLRYGDILFARSGATVGKSFMYREAWGRACYAGYLIRARINPTIAHAEFVSYFANSSVYWNWVSSIFIQATIQNVSGEKYSNLLVTLPSLEQQKAIVQFLDHETAALDALISKKEQLSARLQEKRTALISRAVTKGLDPNAPLKDSGVEWLGEVPEHWEVKRIRDIALSLQTGPFGSQLHSEEYSPGGFPVINPAHLREGKIFPDVNVAVDEATFARLSHHELREGDIVFARRGEMGRCALVTEKENGWLCGSGSMRVRPKREEIHPQFFNHVLSTNGISDWLLLESVGTTMDNLNRKIVGRVPLPHPPLSEQRAIAAHLDRETARLDALVAKIQEGIARLREYRGALIAAAVTGKVDVRQDPKGFQAAAPIETLASKTLGV